MVATTLLRLPEALDEARFRGAVVLMLGIVPRDAVRAEGAGLETRERAV